VVPLQAGAAGPRDELDALVDDVFGPSTDERPGPFDLLLVIAGVILLAWAVLTGAASWVAVVAVVAIVLGLALPARSVVRRYRGAAAARRMRSAGRRGYVLDVTAGSTADLLRAHEELGAAAALPGSVYGERALDAAHEALVEVASLLEGSPPAVPAQDEYVAKRARAIATLSRQLQDAHRTWLAGRAETAAEEAERRERWVTAVTQARDELQAEDRQGSLARLARLTTRLEREAGDDAG
jgi:type IV secretory pathway VirB2 component (pilin)